MTKNSTLIDEICGMLMNSGQFNNFSPNELKSAAGYFNANKIEKDKLIFTEGETGTFMCIINSGNVAVLKTNSKGRNVKIAVLHKGRTFGEMAVLDGEKRSATCVAETDCVLLTLSKESLDKMLQVSPRTAAMVVRAVAISLSRRLRLAVGKLVDYHI